MTYKMLKAYMANCEAYGWKPSWEGLLGFKRLRERMRAR